MLLPDRMALAKAASSGKRSASVEFVPSILTKPRSRYALPLHRSPSRRLIQSPGTRASALFVERSTSAWILRSKQPSAVIQSPSCWDSQHPLALNLESGLSLSRLSNSISSVFGHEFNEVATTFPLPRFAPATIKAAQIWFDSCPFSVSFGSTTIAWMLTSIPASLRNRD